MKIFLQRCDGGFGGVFQSNFYRINIMRKQKVVRFFKEIFCKFASKFFVFLNAKNVVSRDKLLTWYFVTLQL